VRVRTNHGISTRLGGHTQAREELLMRTRSMNPFGGSIPMTECSFPACNYSLPFSPPVCH
jgi:hypothetical protein